MTELWSISGARGGGAILLEVFVVDIWKAFCMPNSCHYDVQLLYSMIYHQFLLKERTSINIILDDDIHGSGMTRDYIVTLVLFRYTIKASVTALTVTGDEWDDHNRVLKSKFLSETGVQCLA